MVFDYNESSLIEKAKAGDESSFELLILNCRTKAYNTALRYLRNEDDAMDALQESFIKVFRHLDKFNGGCKFDTWVYRIVINTCNDMLRKNRHNKDTDSIYKNYQEEETMLEIADNSPSPSDILVSKETTEYVLNCLNLMAPEHKEVIILRDIQGFTYEEISEILECSIGTVKSRINRARLKLRDKLTEQIEQECV